MIGSSSSPPNMLCCRLRMYRGLRTSGFGIVDKKTSYLPFKIILNLEKITLPRESPESCQNEKETAAAGSVPKNPEEDDSTEYYLLAYAVPISTAYKSISFWNYKWKTLKFFKNNLLFFLLKRSRWKELDGRIWFAPFSQLFIQWSGHELSSLFGTSPTRSSRHFSTGFLPSQRSARIEKDLRFGDWTPREITPIQTI